LKNGVMKMLSVNDYLDEEIAKLEVLAKELEDWYESGDFYPGDGGNFDDTYYMGTDHGEIFGRLKALKEVRERIKDA
jgi:hypothetical protein